MHKMKTLLKQLQWVLLLVAPLLIFSGCNQNAPENNKNPLAPQDETNGCKSCEEVDSLYDVAW